MMYGVAATNPEPRATTTNIPTTQASTQRLTRVSPMLAFTRAAVVPSRTPINTSGQKNTSISGTRDLHNRLSLPGGEPSRARPIDRRVTVQGYVAVAASLDMTRSKRNRGT